MSKIAKFGIEYKDYTENSLKVLVTNIFFNLFHKCCQVLEHFIQRLCTADNIKLKELEILEKYVLYEFSSSCTKHDLKAMFFKTLIIFFIKNWNKIDIRYFTDKQVK